MSEDQAAEDADVGDSREAKPWGEDAEDTDESPTSRLDDDHDADETSTSGFGDADVWRYLRLGAIGLLALLALVATIQLYSNTSAAISQWVSPTYVPVFQAAFNLVVLLLALSGLAVLARKRFTGS